MTEFRDHVVAVNDGKVVYGSQEIRGYVNVIVIQHNPNLVLGYANNQFNYLSQDNCSQATSATSSLNEINTVYAQL